MVNLSEVKHHVTIEEMVDVLCARIGNNDRKFFRVISAYFLSVMASTMRANLVTLDRGELPVNSYALALSTSGSGKGHSVNILENEFLHGFRQTFRETTLPFLAEHNMRKLASRRAAKNNTPEDDEYLGLEKEYESTGAYPFVFDGGTVPAVKQVRQKLLLAGAGSINLQIDEIGMNLANSMEILTVYLELYDQGLVKNKLTKNTSENKRTEEIEGKTPANALLFGTPSKLLDGSQAEDLFFSLLDTGYARRCIFALGEPIPAYAELTSEEIFDRRIDPGNRTQIDKWSSHFTDLADASKYGWLIDVPRDIGIQLVEYQVQCEKAARALPENDVIRKAEMEHRYFKALKLAGALAFVEEASVMTEDHLYPAMKLVEESGEAFQSLLRRERAYMKLARYIAAAGTELTHADLLESLPFYKSGKAAQNDMISMATAWGYKQHIMIKKSFMDGIEFFSGETLKKTSLDKLKLSYSNDFAFDYEPVEAPFDRLHELTQEADLHWANHHFEGGHRRDDKVIPGFNMVVIDVDGGIKMEAVHELLADYVFMTHTTKRHTDENHRFRLILPISYELKLDKEEYGEFMTNLRSWLPFATDEASNQASKKWMTNAKGTYHYNKEGRILDVLPFVPKTKKNEDFQARNNELKDLNNLERWFAERIAMGNRNNQMLKFALALVDSGMTYGEVERHVISFNDKLSDRLPEDELRRTVLVTVAKKLQAAP